MRRSRALAALLTAPLLALPLLVASPAVAAPDVEVRVTLERIRLTGGDDGCGDPDWYAKVTIDGQTFDNLDTPSQDAEEGDADITPNWEFSRTVDSAALGAAGQVPLSIEIWEEDGGLCFGDDLFDASQAAGSAIVGAATIAPCGVALDGQTLACEASGVFNGTGGDRVEVTLRVDVEEPASAPGQRIRCMHTPAWPQPGETVTITATSLDGALNPLIADDLEIWVQQDTADVATRTKAKEVSGAAVTTATFTAGADPGNGDFDFAYGCRMTKAGSTVFSGWRRATEGDPGTASFPLVYTGPSSSRLDIVFIADASTYPFGPDAPLNPMFISDIAQVMNTSYYGFDPFLANQDKFNFWVLLLQGTADDANDGGCDHGLPPGWDEDFAFADAGAILHRKSQRDCALRGDRIFSGTLDTNYRSDAYQVVTHETGHQPFGLADEYCDQRPGSTSPSCDGGYFEQEDAPNVYEEPGGCIGDLPAFPGRPESACEEFTEDNFWFFDADYTVSDPGSNDLMADNGQAQGSDIRRMDFIFGNCQAAGC